MAERVSLDDSSFAEPSTPNFRPASQKSATSRRRQRLRKQVSKPWEVLEGLRSGQRCTIKPTKFTGQLWLKRKWPLKGWRKRYGVLQDGVLRISKNFHEYDKGRVRNAVDIALSVISYRVLDRQIDIDADDYIYHFKVKDTEQMNKWIDQLKLHRLYRQDEIAFRSKDNTNENPDTVRVSREASDEVYFTVRSAITSAPSRRLDSSNAATFGDKTGLVRCDKGFKRADASMHELDVLLEQFEKLSSSGSFTDRQSLDLSGKCDSSRNKTWWRKGKGHLRKKHSNQTVNDAGILQASQSQVASVQLQQRGISCSSSSPDIVSLAVVDLSPTASTPVIANNNSVSSNVGCASEGVVVRDDYLRLAREVRAVLADVLSTLKMESDRISGAARFSIDTPLSNKATRAASIATASSDLIAQLAHQNHELKQKLTRIHAESDLSSSSSLNVLSSPAGTYREPQPTCFSREQSTSPFLRNPCAAQNDRYAYLGVPPATSYFSVLSEYYDAQEKLSTCDDNSDVSSLSMDDESLLGESDNEDDERNDKKSRAEDVLSTTNELVGTVSAATSPGVRRERLPVVMPEGSFSVWSILSRNIGKDLSKISMPVIIHEPLSALQVLCEELEYSELLDQACATEDPILRMALVAAFAVSRYAATYYRAERKPFNPLLGETFECIREDKGFRFLSEQVSHHPPVSACHCESAYWTWWQDARVRIKFWGKSMELENQGIVNLELKKFDERYSWNKVTTCVHNMLSGRRWVDQYGDMVINCSSGVRCELLFEKASSWSSRQHEIRGNIFNSAGKPVNKVFGKWTEGFYVSSLPSARCIWRPGAMPANYDDYYGFTRFAMELNELTPELKATLPPTDSRLRPDQRFLEDGCVADADQKKADLESAQRARRRLREEQLAEFKPLWFVDVDNNGNEEEKQWQFTCDYWRSREARFSSTKFEHLW